MIKPISLSSQEREMNLYFLSLLSEPRKNRRESVVNALLPNGRLEGIKFSGDIVIYEKNGDYKLAIWPTNIFFYRRKSHFQVKFCEGYLRFYVVEDLGCIIEHLVSLDSLPSFSGYNLVMRTCIRR